MYIDKLRREFRSVISIDKLISNIIAMILAMAEWKHIMI